MKIKLFLLTLLLVTTTSLIVAQQVGVRLNFPAGNSIGALGHRPYNGAVWIGPEWQWRGRRYVAVPGYWKYNRRCYRWVPGHWRQQQ